MTTQIVAPRVQFVDPETGTISREWFRYLLEQFEQIGGESGLVPVANGGTGLASGTSGAVLYFSNATTLKSSGALASNQIVFGGGAGNAPGTPLTGATSKRVLLSGGVGVLPAWSGYTMPTDTFQGDILYSQVNEVVQRLPKNTTATRSLTNTGTNNNPAWALVNLTTGVEDELLVNNVLQTQVYSW